MHLQWTCARLLSRVSECDCVRSTYLLFVLQMQEFIHAFVPDFRPIFISDNSVMICTDFDQTSSGYINKRTYQAQNWGV